MKKKFLLTTVGVSLLSVGLTTANLSQVVHATKVTAGKTAKFTHNAYIYNSKGKHVKKSTLKKNKTTKVIKIIKIKGKNYAQIGKNQFVKLGNLKVTAENKINKKSTSKKIKKSSTKNVKKDSWKEMHDNYPGFKITANKDTTVKLIHTYEMHTSGRYDDSDEADRVTSYTINFPKGTSVYWINLYGVFVKGDKSKLHYSYDDGAGNTLDEIVDKRDITISKWEPQGENYPILDVADDEIDGSLVIPQAGNYRSIPVKEERDYGNYDFGSSLSQELKKRSLIKEESQEIVKKNEDDE